jgi:hypothetical protein
MRRALPLVLLVVMACDREPVVLEPAEIDVCPVVAEQIENLLVEIVEFTESATVEELAATGGMASDLESRGAQLSQRAIDLGCDPAAVRDAISVDRLESDDPLAGQFIDEVLDALE